MMSANDVMFLTIRTLFILVAIVTLVDLWRFRDRARFEIALLFTALGSVAFISILMDYTSVPNWVNILILMLFLSKPYLLVSLVQHFHPLRPVIRWGALGGLILSWSMLLFFQSLPSLLTAVLLLYYVLLEAYATIAFVRGAWETRGVTRWRMGLIGLGSGAMALLVFLLVAFILLPGLPGELTFPLLLLSLISVGSYYFGFVSPRWLRQVWQRAELQRFMHQMTGRPFPERVNIVTDLLRETAVRATGGLTAGIALWDDKQQQLCLQILEPYSFLNDVLSTGETVTGQAWQGEAICVTLPQDNLDEQTISLMKSVGATTLLIVPVMADEQIHALLLVFLRQFSLFVDDDLALLTLLAEECAFNLSHQIALSRQKTGEANSLRQAARAQALLQVASRLGAQFELEGVIQTICEETAQALSVPVVTVSLYDPESESLHYRGGLGLPSDYPAQIQPMSRSIYDQFVNGQDALVMTPDIQAVAEIPNASLYAQMDLRTTVNVTMLREGELIGRLNIGTLGDVREFTPDELALLRGLADQAALAIAHIQLFEAAQREIAERKRVEEALRQNEIYFRSLSQNTQDIVAVLDVDGQIKYGSPSLEQMLGYELPELLDTSIFQFIHPDDTEYVARSLTEAAGTVNARSLIEFRLRHNGGSWLILEAISKNLLADPVVQGIALDCRDVTKRRRAEDALSHYSERLAAIHEMDKAIAAQSPQAIAQTALMHIHSLLPCRQAGVIVFDFKLQAFRSLAVVSDSEATLSTNSTFTWDEFVADEALWRGEIIVESELTAVSHPTTFEKSMLAEGIHAYMMVPLMTQVRPIGVLHLARQEAGDFTAEEIRVAYEVANPMAAAIEQAQVFQAERNQRELADTLREVTRALSRTLDHHEVLQLILDQLARVVDYDGANVMLLSGNKLNIVARKSPDDATERLTAIEFETLPHVREVLTSQHPVVIADTLLDERWQILPNTDSIRCWLGAPLVVQDKVIGLLNVNKEQAHFYDNEDVEVVEAFAEQAAIAVENSRLYEQAQVELRERIQAEAVTKQRAAHLALINDISREIAAVQELDVVLNKAAYLIQQRFGYHHVALFLLADGVAELKAIAGSYAVHFPTKHVQSLEVGIIGQVAKWGKRIVANDVNKDPHYIPILPDSAQTQAELCLPIKLGGDTVGVLDIQSPKRDAFTANDVTTIETLADQIALAVANARLYEALQEEQASLARRVAARTAELSAANAELARTARSKDEFLASMSHELRTPLNAILSKADIMGEGIYGPLTEAQTRSLQTIKESGHHLLDLINDILDVAKIEAGKLTLDLNPVSVKSICDASLRLVKGMAHNKQIEIVTEYDEQMKVIEADGRRLKQILVNLLSNAVKFTPKGGKVGLAVKGDADSQAAHFTVWDTGIGISPENMRRLFGEASAPKPFVQLDGSLARQFEGTGLGLSLAYNLAELHKGSISVESEIGQGSRFTVLLPWQPREAVVGAQVGEKKGKDKDGTTAVAPTIPSSSKGTTILLAEDNETNIELIQEYLTFVGYHVVLARNGYEAVVRTEEMRPDIVLMDIQMPQMDGLEAIRHIRNKPQFGHIPIIALTALAMPGDRERCLAAGANEYISKPISVHTLMQTIDTQLAELSHSRQE